MPTCTRRRPVPAHRRSLASVGCAAAVTALWGCRGAAPVPDARAAAEPTCGALAAYVVEPRPSLLLTPDGGAYLVLGAGLVQLGSEPAWSIAYLASPDAAAASAPGTGDRLRAAADALSSAQRLVAEAAGATLLSVTGVLGTPGEHGTAEQFVYARRAAGWERVSGPVRGDVRSIPPLPSGAERDPYGEAAALRVAVEFLGDVERADFDAAWALSSAVVKATTSRASFAEQLRILDGRAASRRRRELYRSFPLSARSFIPGSELEVWFERGGADRPSLETVQLRLDDDQEWRVASIQDVTPAERRAPAAGPLTLQRP
jgi:hypothetical protein